MENGWFKSGLVGSVTTGLCCVTGLIPFVLGSPGSVGTDQVCLPRQCVVSAAGDFFGDDGVWVMAQEQAVTLKSTITCPECGHVEVETMPTDACQWFYECKSCAVVLKPKAGDCCVYCSYADVPCPPIQLGDSCCS